MDHNKLLVVVVVVLLDSKYARCVLFDLIT